MITAGAGRFRRCFGFPLNLGSDTGSHLPALILSRSTRLHLFQRGDDLPLAVLAFCLFGFPFARPKSYSISDRLKGSRQRLYSTALRVGNFEPGDEDRLEHQHYGC